jgi:hypothetical protein
MDPLRETRSPSIDFKRIALKVNNIFARLCCDGKREFYVKQLLLYTKEVSFMYVLDEKACGYLQVATAGRGLCMYWMRKDVGICK